MDDLALARRALRRSRDCLRRFVEFELWEFASAVWSISITQGLKFVGETTQ